MRARLAAVLAAAVVFAPGWGADRPADSVRPSNDVAARILAPTFDEAAETRTAGSTQKRFDRVGPRSEPSKLLPWQSVSGTPARPLGLILAAATVVAPLQALEGRLPRLGRAPPYPLTV